MRRSDLNDYRSSMCAVKHWRTIYWGLGFWVDRPWTCCAKTIVPNVVLTWFSWVNLLSTSKMARSHLQKITRSRLQLTLTQCNVLKLVYLAVAECGTPARIPRLSNKTNNAFSMRNIVAPTLYKVGTGCIWHEDGDVNKIRSIVCSFVSSSEEFSVL